MKMYIPHCGNKIRLTKDWTFNLIPEERNQSLISLYYPDWNSLNHNEKYGKWEECEESDPENNGYGVKKVGGKQIVQHTIPAGTILMISRVYVRNAGGFKEKASDYDSVTFKVVDENGKETSTPVKYFENTNYRWLFPDGTEQSVTALWNDKKLKWHGYPEYCHKYNGVPVKQIWDTKEKERKVRVRFWAKLDDVNNIEFEMV